MTKRQPDYYRVKEDGRFWATKFQTKLRAEEFAKERRNLITGTGKKGIYVYAIRIKRNKDRYW